MQPMQYLFCRKAYQKKDLWLIGLKQICPDMVAQLWPEIEDSIVTVEGE
jgi:hypothetical protein